jgi:hypothetical protein
LETRLQASAVPTLSPFPSVHPRFFHRPSSFCHTIFCPMDSLRVAASPRGVL